MKMKFSFSLLIFSFLLSITGFSQVAADNRRYIEVTGSAETTLKPDYVDLMFNLKEFVKKGSRDKTDLNTITAEFFQILSGYGLSEKNVTLGNTGAANVDWYTYKQNKRYDLKYKRYTIKIDSSVNIPKLMEDLNKDWMDYISIAGLQSKQEQAARKEVKMLAMKAAKEKADYLLAAIGEQTGKVIFIEELPTDVKSDSRSNVSNIVSAYGEGYEGIDNTNMIRLRYEIKARFEIK